MKKVLSLLIILVLVFSLVACGTTETKTDSNVVKNQEITLDLSTGAKSGKYTGPLNENGLPEGEGKFVTQNGYGVTWTYTGSFVNGHFEGEGSIVWDAKGVTPEKGTYRNDVIVPLDKALLGAVYFAPEKYIGNCIEITGKVYNIMKTDGSDIYIQLYQDPDNSDNNTIVVCNDEHIKEGDYVKVTGIVEGTLEYQNAFGLTMSALGILSHDIKKTTYAEAVSPSLKTVTVNQTQTQYGYSVTVEKVEFAKTETRVYVKVENKGKSNFSLLGYSSVAVQNGNQFETTYNIFADYPSVSTDMRPGVTSSGILLYPQMSQSSFTLYLNGMSDDFWNESIKEMTFNITV